MKITCTEDEKAELIFELTDFALENDDLCLFTETRGRCIGKVSCQQCIADNIEWEVEDGQFRENNSGN